MQIPIVGEIDLVVLFRVVFFSGLQKLSQQGSSWTETCDIRISKTCCIPSQAIPEGDDQTDNFNIYKHGDLLVKNVYISTD